MNDFDTLVTALRAGTRHQDGNRKAAVELLIWHETWLRRSSFVRAAIGTASDGRYIRWADAREFADSGPRASTSELAVLDFAVALGEDRYRLGIMGGAHAAAIVNAVKTAVGMESDG